MKKIIYSLVIMIAASTLFTSCLEYVEPQGIQQLRVAKADYLDALATLRLADAELQKANATYVLAQAAFQDALTEAQQIENRIREYDVQIKAAETEYEVDSLQKEKELLQITHAERLADAKADLAEAEENLRTTLRDIAALQHLLTPGERQVLAQVTQRYLLTLYDYNEALYTLEERKERLWRLEYALNHDLDWEADYQAEIDFFTAEIARAQAALAAVPEKLDLEAWNAEIENMKDSIDAYNYGRQAISRDSALYMVNVYCEGSEAYARAFEAWLAEKDVTVSGTTLNVDNLVEPVANPGAAPSAPNFSSAAARLTKDFLMKHGDLAAELVYQKFYDLVDDYYQDAPFPTDSTAANGGYFMNKIANATADTLRIKATVDMKDFILNDSTDVKRVYQWKRSDNSVVDSEGEYGLRGALNILQRELVLIDAASNVPAAQAAYDAAKQAWEDDRAYLIGKTYETEAAAALENLKTIVFMDPPVSPAGKAEDLIWIIKEFINSRTDHGEGNSPMDTTHLLAAIKNLMEAKRAYIGDPVQDFSYDYLEYDYMGVTHYEYLGDLDINKLRQRDAGGGQFTSIYAGVKYTTHSNAPKRAVDSTWAGTQTPPEEYHYDAILKIFRVLFPDVATNGNFDTWKNAETWVNGLATLKAGTDELKWMYDDGTLGGANASVPGYDITLEGLGLLSMANQKFIEVYNRFWNPDPAITIATIADATNDAGCYNWNTFCTPYRLVRFTGTDINDNTDLRVVLSLVDPNNATRPNKADWDDVNEQSAIFGKTTHRTEFFDMLYAEQLLIIEEAKTTYSATLAEIETFVNEVETAFDAKKTQMENAYQTATNTWTTKKAAYDAYVAAKKAKIEELLEELTGAKDGDIVQTIEEPVDYMVASCMKEYADHLGNAVFNGEYALGGKQLEWANEFLEEYPANLKDWMIRTRTANHVIMHLENLLTVLDPAYQAATAIYTYDWEKYVLDVDPDDHTYEIDIETMNQDLSDGAADLAGYFANYNLYQQQYTNAWKAYLEDCKVELRYWKEMLAAFEAGYDPLQMAVKEQKGIVDNWEVYVAYLKTRLDHAKAEYEKSLQIILNN